MVEFRGTLEVPLGAPDLSVNLFVDGKYIDDCLSPADPRQRSGSFKGVWEDECKLRLFDFKEPRFGVVPSTVAESHSDGQCLPCMIIN